MMRLILAEWKYDKFMLAAYWFFVLMIFSTVTNLELNGVTIDVSVPQLITIAIMVMLIMRRVQEKRTRCQCLLPVSERRLGIARLLYQGVYWGIAMLAYWISQIPLRGSHPVLWRMLLFNATFMMANAAFMISFDLFANGRQRCRLLFTMLATLMWLSIVLMNMLFVGNGLYAAIRQQALPPWMPLLYTTSAGVLMQHLLALGLLYVSLIVFTNRRNYTV